MKLHLKLLHLKDLNLHLSIKIKLWINILAQPYLIRTPFNKFIESKRKIITISDETKLLNNFSINSLVVEENTKLLNKIKLRSLTNQIRDDLRLTNEGMKILQGIS